jgi:hypothetical protein
MMRWFGAAITRLVEDRLENRLLRLEVLVEGAEGDVGRVRDSNRRRAVPLGSDHRSSGSQEPPTRVGAPARAAVEHLVGGSRRRLGHVSLAVAGRIPMIAVATS